ncbi:ABC transporter substrate-binding protein [Actinopolymorpha rutila]|uniref:Peptide/nickel transport system substrate-binding protein n=1 Tax=Actinopolymorpha rutila TaxID=446787 RepID=A0A852ZB71_9ACTN|nr:ABC transporter substrate-binding protein [Actinopolymorpha rutila]NYH90427.1 peptide/nickel transport system substrate-binding protein [Actinopolymorpha rutila]
MDPNVSYYAIGYLGLRMWSRQLFTYPAENGKVTTSVPDLAEEIPTADNKGISADGKTYTISIRQGAQWNSSPARQVTAADMVRGVKRTCNPVQPFGGIPNFADLIVGYQKFCDGFAKVGQSPAAMAKYINDTPLPGVAAKDERTVVFKLTHPATYFVDMLTLPAFSPAPKEFLKYAPASLDLAKNTLSDGPYAIKTYSPTKQIVFERNPAWKASSDPVRKAYVDKIVVNQTVSQESTQQQLQTGSPSADMEWDNFPPPSQLPQLIAKKDPNLNLGETGSSNPYIVFNTVSPNNSGALKKPEVRQALAYAVNRTNIIQALGGPKVNPPLTHVLPSSIVGSKDFDPYPHNVAKAKQLLAKAGYKKGLTLKFVYRNASEGSRKTFATVQQDLKAVGVDVKGVAVPNADFYTKYMQAPDVTKRGVWDVSLAGWGSDWYGNAALSFFAPLFSGKPSFPPIGSNFGFYENPAVNKLITQASNAKDESTAGSLWAQADQQVMKDAPFFPITNPVQANYHASQTKNAVYLPSMQNFDPTNIWLEQGKQGG